jgi:hypothetical protein
MKKKTLIITFSILVLLIVGAWFSYYYIFEAPKKDIVARCAGYVPYWENFIECYGTIAITDGWLSDYISLDDHIHNYEIAGIDNINQYIHTDNKIFVINRHLMEGSSSDGTRTRYYLDFFQNGKLTTNYYDSISDIPTYLVIDFRSGEVEAYKNIDEVPQEYRQYFLKLQNR